MRNRRVSDLLARFHTRRRPTPDTVEVADVGPLRRVNNSISWAQESTSLLVALSQGLRALDRVEPADRVKEQRG